MGLVAEYEITFRHLPLVEVTAAVPEATLTVDVGQPNQGGPPPFIVRVTGGSVDAVERAFERTAFVGTHSLVGRDAETVRYRIVPATSMAEQLGRHVDDPEELRALAGNDSIVEHIEVTPTGWQQQRWFADRAAFDRYCVFWRETAASFSLLGLSNSEALAESTPADGMTDCQREALRTAYEMGYFEIPRTASLNDIADELGITASSLSERLRRGQAHLVESTVSSPGVYKRPHRSGTGLAE